MLSKTVVSEGNGSLIVSFTITTVFSELSADVECEKLQIEARIAINRMYPYFMDFFI